MVDGLRSILAGIGAATHGRTVPHIHVQHGEVRGATLASGQVLPPGGIAVGTEDLALTGADYIALGHIHARRRSGATLDGRRALCRSAPTRWTGASATRRRSPWWTFPPSITLPGYEEVPYGHPARIKLELNPGHCVWRCRRASTEGIDAWFAIKVPADYSEHDATELRERVEAGSEGFANSVRVTIERAPRERVRVPEIRSAGTWADQVREWVKHTRVRTG